LRNTYLHAPGTALPAPQLRRQAPASRAERTARTDGTVSRDGNAHPGHPGHDRCCQGFTLLEVLIALLVLSVGLLGLAALQTTGLHSIRMAGMRTLAGEAASDITERMRANPAGVARREYLIARTASVTGTPSNRAEQDLAAWRRRVERLPDGRGEITSCPPASDPACAAVDGKTTHIITIYWNEGQDPAPSGFHCPPQTGTDYRCLRLVTR
jgi:type IV pilus assembly protein PilV